MNKQLLRRRARAILPLSASLALTRARNPKPPGGHSLEVALSLFFWTFLKKALTVDLVLKVKYQPLPTPSHEDKTAREDAPGS